MKDEGKFKKKSGVDFKESVSTIREKYNLEFEKSLSKLNPDQKEAVNHTDGPILVIAGPGTGKTEILAARIGVLIKERSANAHEILCLTYTEAGVVAMRKRLFKFIMARSLPG